MYEVKAVAEEIVRRIQGHDNWALAFSCIWIQNWERIIQLVTSVQNAVMRSRIPLAGPRKMDLVRMMIQLFDYWVIMSHSPAPNSGLQGAVQYYMPGSDGQPVPIRKRDALQGSTKFGGCLPSNFPVLAAVNTDAECFRRQVTSMPTADEFADWEMAIDPPY